MSILCERPDAEFFRTIPDIHDAERNFNKNDVKSKLVHFGRIFLKHDVEQEYGLAMVHRHFDVSKDEVLVETLNNEKSVSVTSPWIIKDMTVVVPENETLWTEYGTNIKQYVVPQTWSFDENGSLKAFEYLTADVPLENPSKAFAGELYLELRKLGLEGILGIRRIVNFCGRSSWESTPTNVRSNVVYFGTRPESLKNENMIPVLWHYDENGKLYQNAWCNHCFYHC